MNNTKIKNISNSNDSSITKIMIQNCQIMTNITDRILKSMIKKPVVSNCTFFTVTTVSNINSFAYINSIVMQHL